MECMRRLTTISCFVVTFCVSAAAESPRLQIEWGENMLTIRGPNMPGERIDTLYLEAFCRKGSTHRKWEETVIPHTTRSLSANADKSRIRLESTVDGGVIVAHDIQAKHDCVTFDLVVTNRSDSPVDIEWAQPCMRVDRFTGKGKEDYIANCFIFTEAGPVMLDKTRRTEDAIYKGGQVYVPHRINRDDVNPRPLSPDVPENDLIGCVSADGKWLVATAWDHTQELFQGIITCIHADFRIGGLAPKETKRVHGVVYIMPNDFGALLNRYRSDFPAK